MYDSNPSNTRKPHNVTFMKILACFICSLGKSSFIRRSPRQLMPVACQCVPWQDLHTSNLKANGSPFLVVHLQRTFRASESGSEPRPQAFLQVPLAAAAAHTGRLASALRVSLAGWPRPVRVASAQSATVTPQIHSESESSSSSSFCHGHGHRDGHGHGF
jgi:hypothetical protein